MKAENLTSIEQLEDFLPGTQPVMFTVAGGKTERYQWIQRTLIKFDYLALSKRDKGTLRCYLMKISGYSRQQLTRLIRQYRKAGRLRRQPRAANGFARRYRDEDIRLLAKMDAFHDTPSGPRLKKLCERAFEVFGQIQYQRLAKIIFTTYANPSGIVKVDVALKKHAPRPSPSVSAASRHLTGNPATCASIPSIRAI